METRNFGSIDSRDYESPPDPSRVYIFFKSKSRTFFLFKKVTLLEGPGGGRERKGKKVKHSQKPK
jgi:hypothetical protein